MSLFKNYGVRCNGCGVTYTANGVGNAGQDVRASAQQQGWKFFKRPGVAIGPCYDFCPSCEPQPLDQQRRHLQPIVMPALVPRRLADYLVVVLTALLNRGALQRTDLVRESLLYLRKP